MKTRRPALSMPHASRSLASPAQNAAALAATPLRTAATPPDGFSATCVKNLIQKKRCDSHLGLVRHRTPHLAPTASPGHEARVGAFVLEGPASPSRPSNAPRGRDGSLEHRRRRRRGAMSGMFDDAHAFNQPLGAAFDTSSRTWAAYGHERHV